MEAMLRRRREHAPQPPAEGGADKAESASATGKVFAVLEALGTHGPSGISELSHRLGISKTTVHRFLQTLKTLGFVAQEDETERYRLTIRLFELGSLALESVDLIREADLEMRRIGRLTREALHLGAFDADHIIYIHKIDADYGLRMHSRIGRTNPLYSTAIGKVLLAWMAPEEARETLSRIEFRKSTQKTLASAEAVWSNLPHVREQGYGEDNEEQEDGLLCLAVPVFDRFGRVIAGAVDLVSDHALRRRHEGALRRAAQAGRAGHLGQARLSRPARLKAAGGR